MAGRSSEVFGAPVAPKHIKIVVVGDGNVGKTSLLFTYKDKRFPEGLPATVFDNYPEKVFRNEETYAATLVDTAGSEEYARMRILNYHNVDSYILCYSTINRASFDNLTSNWLPEMTANSGQLGGKIVLVGTKKDAKDNSDRDHVALEQGKQLATSIKAAAFFETSAKQFENVTEVFEAAFDAAIAASKNKKHLSTKPNSRCCCVLM